MPSSLRLVASRGCSQREWKFNRIKEIKCKLEMGRRDEEGGKGNEEEKRRISA